MEHTWLDNIKTEDLPEVFRELTIEIENGFAEKLPVDQKELAEPLALTAMLYIMKNFEGDEPYFPRFDGTKFLPTRNSVIKMEWKKEKGTGGRVNAGRLARKFDITVRRLRSIVNDHEDQKDLFTEQ